jgi:hypothetical protein
LQGTQGLQLQYLKGPNDEVILIGLGESTLGGATLGKNLHFFGYILVNFGGNFSFISSKVLITIYNGF